MNFFTYIIKFFVRPTQIFMQWDPLFHKVVILKRGKNLMKLLVAMCFNLAIHTGKSFKVSLFVRIMVGFFCNFFCCFTRLEVILLILRSNDNTMKNIQLAVEPGVASYFRKLTSLHPIITPFIWYWCRCTSLLSVQIYGKPWLAYQVINAVFSQYSLWFVFWFVILLREEHKRTTNQVTTPC